MVAILSRTHQRIILPDISQTRAVFPHAKRLVLPTGPSLVLPHDSENTRVARNFGFDIISPAEAYYGFSGGKPYAAQADTVGLLTMHERAFVLNGMGTGKTRCALWAYDYLRQRGESKRMLVVAPLSTLQRTWAREVFMATPHLTAAVLHGSKAQRLKTLATPADIYIINHDGIATVFDQLVARTDIDVVVLDELAVYRNASTSRWRLMTKLLAKKPRAWGMTGSPTPNEPTDAWAQAKLIAPGNVNITRTAFRDEVMLKVSAFKYVPKEGSAARAHRLMQPAVRYTLDDVVELPDVMFENIDVPLGSRQQQVYDAMRAKCFVQFQQGEVNAVNSAVMTSKLLQIAMGWVYTTDKGVIGLDNEARIEALIDRIESTDRKVIVFAPFIHALEGLQTALKKAGHDFPIVSGDVSKNQRDQIFAQFQGASNMRGIVAHPQCMAHGLTLTEASTVAWFGPFPSLEIFDQANARITRIGQKHKQQILMFGGTKVENHLYARLREKQRVQSVLLDLFAEQTQGKK